MFCCLLTLKYMSLIDSNVSIFKDIVRVLHVAYYFYYQRTKQETESKYVQVLKRTKRTRYNYTLLVKCLKNWSKMRGAQSNQRGHGELPVPCAEWAAWGHGGLPVPCAARAGETRTILSKCSLLQTNTNYQTYRYQYAF